MGKYRCKYGRPFDDCGDCLACYGFFIENPETGKLVLIHKIEEEVLRQALKGDKND